MSRQPAGYASLPDSVHACPRQLDGFISRYESRLTRYLVQRVPRNLTPDHMTMIGVVGAVCIAVGLTASNVSKAWLWLAVLGLVLHWVGDSLDGTLARYRKIERPRYGFFIDYQSDVFSLVLMAAGLGLSPFLRFDMACLLLIGYFLLSIYTLVKLHVERSVQLEYFGVGGTEARIILAACFILAFSIDVPEFKTVFGTMSLFDCVALFGVFFLFGAWLVSFAQDARKLAQADPVARKQVVIVVSAVETNENDEADRRFVRAA